MAVKAPARWAWTSRRALDLLIPLHALMASGESEGLISKSVLDWAMQMITHRISDLHLNILAASEFDS